MEKFDKHIKAKLEERRSVPSEEAWTKIRQSLPLDQRPRGIRKYAWTIAASFIGILLLTGLLYQQKQTDEMINPVVNRTMDVVIPQKESEVMEITESDGKVIQEGNEQPFVIKVEKKPLEATVVNTEKPDKETMQPLKEVEMEKPLDVIAIKANEVFTQVAKLERMSLVEVTDAEVDSLLRVAQDEILDQKLFRQNGTVDAMALLTEVEDELDGTFRDQIFDALKDGYLKLRTAVADRNK